MPKAKPMVLNPAKRRKAEAEERRAAELSLTPISELPEAPAELKGHAAALVVYRRLMSLYAELVAEVVTALDLDTLLDYCLTMEQIGQLDGLRNALYRSLVKARSDEKKLELEQRLLAMDARCERKRVLAQRLRESLYLTPRARAGAAPPTKPPEPEVDPMEALLLEVGSVLEQKRV